MNDQEPMTNLERRPGFAGAPGLGVIREVTFREAVFQDGLRCVIGVRARFENPSGELISPQEAARLAIQHGVAQDTPPMEDHEAIGWLLTSAHWPEWELEGKSKETSGGCEYLPELKLNEWIADCRQRANQRREYSECFRGCNDS